MHEPDRNPYASPSVSPPPSQKVEPRRHTLNIALLIVASGVAGFLLSPADPLSMVLYTAVILSVVGWSYWLGGRR